MGIGLPSPLLSRFDLILMLKDRVDTDWDSFVCDYVLDDYTSRASTTILWTMEMLQAYFFLIKKIHPVLTSVADKILTTYYHTQRRSLSRNKARTTVRLLDSLVR